MQNLQILQVIIDHYNLVLFLFITTMFIQTIRRAGTAHEKFRAQEESITGLTGNDF